MHKMLVSVSHVFVCAIVCKCVCVCVCGLVCLCAHVFVVMYGMDVYHCDVCVHACARALVLSSRKHAYVHGMIADCYTCMCMCAREHVSIQKTRAYVSMYVGSTHVST